MTDNLHVDEISDSLSELIEEHLERIREILRTDSLADAAEEATRLNELLSSYKKRTELLARLSDASTPEKQRKEIREVLAAQRVCFEASQIEHERIIARSYELIARSAHLVAMLHRKIDKEAHKHSGYLLEACGFCKGMGVVMPTNPCPVCKGKGNVLVHQPSIKCPRCKGTGKPEAGNFYPVCQVCRGFGWVLTIDSRESIH